MQTIKTTIYFPLFLLFLFATQASAQSTLVSLQWTDTQTRYFDSQEIQTLGFADADNADGWGLLPVYSQVFPEPAPGLQYEFEITKPEYAFIQLDDPTKIVDLDLVGDEIAYYTEKITIRGRSQFVFKLLPLRKNEATGRYQKLLSFELNKTLIPAAQSERDDEPAEYAENSVLSTGEWYKISVGESGIYKVSWEDLDALGMNLSGVQSKNLRLFGNGGGMLPQRTSDFRHDDLIENSIEVYDGGDGNFDAGDYFLFYGQSPNPWRYNVAHNAFEHSTNLYTKNNFYFLSVGSIEGKRVSMIEEITSPAQKIIDTYQDYAVHELNINSLIKSGAEWYGEEFFDNLVQEFNFDFPHRDLSQDIYIDCDVAARSTTTTSFSLYVNSDSIFSDNVSAISENSVVKYANPSNKSRWFSSNEMPDLNIHLQYNRPVNDAIGWLNFISINVTSHLIFYGSELAFRNVQSYKSKNISEFRISETTPAVRVWDITDPLSPAEVPVVYEDGITKFVNEADALHEFLAFDGSEYLKPGLVGYVPNQNLHAYHTANYIIVSHPDFIDQAQRLADLHETIDGFKVIVVDIYEIYNEFSSGAPDVSAVRDFVRMVYQRSGTPPALKYLLLIGDGSYDPFDRVGGNLSFLPTFQAKNSIWPTSSYVTDDYFGLMDPQEGNDASGNIDLGIGRFAVNTHEEAKLMVDKVELYMKNQASVFGDWRNSLTFVADDEDNNLHILQADTILVAGIQRRNKTLNISKIYLDSYRQERTTGGYAYPQAKYDLNKKINEGTLIVNYTGHGGETGLSHEHVVQVSDIISWHNSPMLPVFITATCEFSRFDNPVFNSAGEQLVLNPQGGGIALFTTTRVAFAGSNLLLNKRLYDTLFRAWPEEHPRLGDLMMFSKTPSNTNLRNFVLLGDPALKLALPQHKVITDSINGVPADEFTDTLMANSRLHISGHIESFANQGSVLTDFNGTIHPVLYDKPNIITTLGNDDDSYPYAFKSQNSELCRGVSSVKDGRFAFSFMLPLDISFQYGEGKLSYYAADSLSDASGEFSKLMIGGVDGTASTDKTGPEIQIFLNEKNVELPGQTNPDPILYALLSDPSGINATGAGIGHDIVLSMTGEDNKEYVLNDMFEPALDDYTSGNITFPMEQLPNGDYTLSLKAWDMFNNSTTNTITFTVSNDIAVDIFQIYNYPNPFGDHTWFTFRHNQFKGELTMEIEIYNFYGQHVRTIGPEKVFTDGYSIAPVLWQGDSEGGSKLEDGVYFYTVKVSNQKGQFTQRRQKLIIAQ